LPERGDRERGFRTFIKRIDFSCKVHLDRRFFVIEVNEALSWIPKELRVAPSHINRYIETVLVYSISSFLLLERFDLFASELGFLAFFNLVLDENKITLSFLDLLFKLPQFLQSFITEMNGVLNSSHF
jgi:hypothetical protein